MRESIALSLSSLSGAILAMKCDQGVSLIVIMLFVTLLKGETDMVVYE